MSTGSRLAVLAGVIVIAIGGLVLARSGGDDNSSDTSTTTTAATSTTPTAATQTATTKKTTTPKRTVKPPAPVHNITVKNGKPVGGVQEIKVKKGDQVRLLISSDVKDEIHVHGYDLHADALPGRRVGMTFKATSDGNYEIELEGRKEQIAQLTVEP
jgi:heme/copper-type cytochrome/quinol oxidase subunit 2